MKKNATKVENKVAAPVLGRVKQKLEAALEKYLETLTDDVVSKRIEEAAEKYMTRRIQENMPHLFDGHTRDAVQAAWEKIEKRLEAMADEHIKKHKSELLEEFKTNFERDFRDGLREVSQSVASSRAEKLIWEAYEAEGIKMRDDRR